MNKVIYTILVISVIAFACGGSGKPRNDGEVETPTSAPPLIPHTVVNVYPHDTNYFTEGFEFHDGQLFEASGSGSATGEGEELYPSAFGVVDLKTGKVDNKVVLDNKKFFGEGITFFKGKVYQLTYTTKVGFVYDAKTFKKIREFPIPTKEGWGLTHDTANLIMSDGTNMLHFINPDTLRVVNILGVTDNNGPVANLNELEYIDGFIYANQWETPYILKIDPSSGKVVGRVDFSDKVNEVINSNPLAREFNGIAYDKTNNKLYVTGKLWPNIYEIKIF
jgi:glutamine cyclotransferase